MTKKIVVSGLIAAALVLTPVIIFGQNTVADPPSQTSAESQPVQTAAEVTAAATPASAVVENLCTPSSNSAPPSTQHTWNGKKVFTGYFTVGESGVTPNTCNSTPAPTPTPSPTPTPVPPGSAPPSTQHTWNGKKVFTGYFTVGENGVTTVP